MESFSRTSKLPPSDPGVQTLASTLRLWEWGGVLAPRSLDPSSPSSLAVQTQPPPLRLYPFLPTADSAHSA